MGIDMKTLDDKITPPRDAVPLFKPAIYDR